MYVGKPISGFLYFALNLFLFVYVPSIFSFVKNFNHANYGNCQLSARA